MSDLLAMKDEAGVEDAESATARVGCYCSPKLRARFEQITGTADLLGEVQAATDRGLLLARGGLFAVAQGCANVFWVGTPDKDLPIRIVAVTPPPILGRPAGDAILGGAELQELMRLLLSLGCDDVSWSESLEPPRSAEHFSMELVFVIINSGMRFTVARKIFTNVSAALRAGRSASTAFGHAQKARAIDELWTRRATYFRLYELATDKLAFLGGLPFVGPITKYHAAKNFAIDTCKPDVHLFNIGNALNESPLALCTRLAREAGLRVATVDSVLWRGSAVHLLDSRTARLHPERLEEARLILDREAAAFEA